MSDIGSNQLTSIYSKTIRKPINSSRNKKKSLHFGHDLYDLHDLGDYANKSQQHRNLSN